MCYEIEKIGKRIRQLRRDRDMTQEQLAEKLNVGIDHLGKIETGKHRCSIEILIDMAAFFDVSLDYLILGKEHSDAAAARIDAAIAELTALRKIL